MHTSDLGLKLSFSLSLSLLFDELCSTSSLADGAEACFFANLTSMKFIMAKTTNGWALTALTHWQCGSFLWKAFFCLYPLDTDNLWLNCKTEDKSRLNLSSETVAFPQSVFWHVGLPVSTNKLFRMPHKPIPCELSKELFLLSFWKVASLVRVQVQSKSYVKKKISIWCKNTKCNARLGTAEQRLFC